MGVATIRMGLWPSSHVTHVVAQGRGSETILRATLSSRPSNARAVPTFFEALALWEGWPVSGVLVADASSTSRCPMTLYRDTFATFDDRAHLYELAWVQPAPRHRGAERTGNFRSLERLLRAVAR